VHKTLGDSVKSANFRYRTNTIGIEVSRLAIKYAGPLEFPL